MVALAPPTALALTEALPGAPPPSCGALYPAQCLIQTRNGGFSLSSHVVRAGGTITGTVTNRCLYRQGTDPCPIDWSGLAAQGRRVSGCRNQDLTCTIRVPTNASSTGYFVVNIGITSDQGVGWSSEYYAIVGRGSALIKGTVTNKDGDPVAGIEVSMLGGGSDSYAAVSGPDGSYAADVNAGRYRVMPSGKSLSSRHPPGFTPEHQRVSAPTAGTATANFTADIGVVVKLSLTPSSVPADGLHIVQGTVTVTELGRPRPNATVALWPQASEAPNAAVTSGARVTLCGSSGRIWPGGTLVDPAGGSVDVVTDATGTYKFTLDVGTVPGPFAVTAWARDEHGRLITHDPSEATDVQTVSATALGTNRLDEFVSHYDALAGSADPTAGISADPNSIIQTLEQFTAAQSSFGGYAYALGEGTSASVLIYSAANPPVIQSDGTVVADADDLVLQPGAWQGIPNVAATDLAQVLRDGTLPGLPTFSQWAEGTTIGGWSTSAQAMTVASQRFQFFGWPYPSSSAGACS